MLLANTRADWARDGAQALAQATGWLLLGGIVAVPTESVYGLAVCAGHTRAVADLRELKGREAHKPMPLVAADGAMVAQHFAAPGGPLETLMQRCWPGPLTVALEPTGSWPQGIVSADGTAGVRVSAHPVLQALCRATGGLITATSANFSGEPAVDRWADAPARLRAGVLWLDAGTLPGGAPSTVVLPCGGGRVHVAREGAITRAALRALLGDHVVV